MAQNVNEYWSDKTKNTIIAERHVAEMTKKYGTEIENSIKDTVVYTETHTFHTVPNVPKENITLEDLGSVEAVHKYSGAQHGKVAVLNFASWKNPGGMFLKGSLAQEEALCHKSTLYNVLSAFENTYYDNNRKFTNRALYKNRGLYSPAVMFNGTPCDVITVAAPNKSAAVKWCGVSELENKSVLAQRIKFVLNIAKEQNVDTLILGAFGCGVFGQSATDVTTYFCDLLTKEISFNKVVFAIPKSNNGNYDKAGSAINTFIS